MSPRISVRGARRFKAGIALAFGALLLVLMPPPAQASTWVIGDVFLGVSEGQYQERAPNGTQRDLLNDGVGGTTTGCVEHGGKLYTTDWGAGNPQIVVYDETHPHPIVQTILTAPLDGSTPESITFDPDENLLVGTVEGGGPDANDVLKLAPDGTLLDHFDVETENIGSDWIDLSSDGHTLFYTSEGARIFRYDLATKIQLPDFADLTYGASVAYALRLLPPFDGTGGLLLADNDYVKRLDASGNVVQTYTKFGEGAWFSLNLDPDGTSFWAGSYTTGHVVKFDITSGAVVGGFDTGVGSFRLYGVCIKGEEASSSADLSVTKSASPNPVIPGSNVTYTINVGNAGPGAATSAVVTDNLPISETFVSCSSTGGGVCGGSGNNRTVSFASLAANASATVTIAANVNLSNPNGTKIDNTASIGSSTPDPNPANNSSTARVVTAVAPSISITDAWVPEGNSGTSIASFTIPLSAPSNSPVTVKYRTADGSASAAEGDYVAIPATTLTFSPGETTKTVGVTINGDLRHETGEGFFVQLSSPTGGVIADGSGEGNILDEEGPIYIYVSDTSVVEGNAGTRTATFTVSLSAAPIAGQTISLKYQTADGTATAGSDYVAIPLTSLTFAAGETSKTVSVTVNGDTAVEPNETFFLKFPVITIADGRIGDQQGQATIINDD
jgi:uncharacterized repeat protein (TIGR01451 family)